MDRLDVVLRALKDCQRRLRQLKAGQQLAANAEAAFSDLANTVDRVLEERRSGTERRRSPRTTPDRRRSASRTG